VSKAKGLGFSAPEPRFPPGIPYIIGNEAAERFSFYGMRAILYVYLAGLYTSFLPEPQVPPELLGAAKAKATTVTHLFMAGVYAFPMLGAVLADRVLGKYKVILWVSLLYCVGHGVLAVAGHFATSTAYLRAEYGMYAGLCLVAIGTGGIKPCVSANVGDQFTEANRTLVNRVYQAFYFIINFGSFYSTLLTPVLYAQFGPEVAFGVPGVMMGIATFVFWLGRNRFTRIPPKTERRLGLMDLATAMLLFSPVVALIAAVFVVGDHFKPSRAESQSVTALYLDYVQHYVAYLARESWPYFLIAAVLVGMGFAVFRARQRLQPDDGFLAVVWYAWQTRKTRRTGSGAFGSARDHFGDEAVDGAIAVLRIIAVFSMTSVFFALFDQHASTWVEQAKQLNRKLVVPLWLGRYLLAATLVLGLYAGLRLFVRVSNRSFPRAVQRAFLAILGLAGALALALDLTSPRWLSLELKAAQLQALNPLMVMLIIPLLNWGVYGPLERRGVVVKPLVRMTIGMFLAAAAFAVAALLQTRIEALRPLGGSVHAGWQVPQYWIMTTAEVLVSVTGLEFAYTQAPLRMKSTMMGFWLLCTTLGNVLVAFLSPLQRILTQSQFFWVFTALMTLAASVFALLAYRYRGKTYLHGA
jgi:proton-dependent oligopeptide transporter, POT family